MSITLIEVSVDNLVHDLAEKQREIRAAKSEAGKARKRCKDLQTARDGIIVELEKRDAVANDLPLPLDDEAEDEEEPEEE